MTSRLSLSLFGSKRVCVTTWTHPDRKQLGTQSNATSPSIQCQFGRLFYPPFFFFFESWLTLAYNFGIVSFHCQFFFLCERKIHHRHRTQTRHTHNTETQNKRQKLGAKWIIFKRHLEGWSISPFWLWVLLFFLWTRTSFIFVFVFFWWFSFVGVVRLLEWREEKSAKA